MKKTLLTLLAFLLFVAGAKAQDMTSTPLTFEALEDGTTITVDNPLALTIEYSTNGGTTWTSSSDNPITLSDIAAGGTVCFRGNNAAYATSSSASNSTIFSADKAVYAYGNVMSLINASSFASLTTLTGNYAFANLFNKTTNNNVRNHASKSLVLPATTLTNSCYYQMFRYCRAMTIAPVLPATTLATRCYQSMFWGCMAMTTAPSLPASTLANYCYSGMFGYCHALSIAPELPATTLVPYCYQAMFRHCTSLNTAPTLPANTLTTHCYDYMFYDCNTLETAPALPATTLADYCYNAMFYNCSSLTAAPALPATTLANYCYNDMFFGCTSLTSAPDLLASTLVESCYACMFSGCSSLNYVKCLATDMSAAGCTNNWLGSVAATGTFVKAAAADWSGMTTSIDVAGIPAGWTVEDYFDPYSTPLTFEAIETGTINIDNPNTLTIEYNKNGGAWTSVSTNPINITVDANDVVQFRGNNTCYWASGGSGELVTRFTATNNVYVYGNVMSLIDKTDFATNMTLTEEFALSYLFTAPGADIYSFYSNNTTIKSHASKDLVLPATTLTGTCYGYLFAGCQGLTRAPQLPATTLDMGCYHQMFADCSGLTVAPELPATTLTDMCYSSMFFNCTGLTEAPELPAATLAEGCYYGMFEGCTNLNYVKCLATDISATNCTENWLSGVAATGTFVKAPDMTGWTENSVNGIPAGWTVKEDMTNEPLTFEVISGTALVSFHPVGITVYGVQCRKTTSGSWGDWQNLSSGTIYWAINSGEKIQFRKENNDPLSNNTTEYSYFGISNANCYVYGNVMSLFNFGTTLEDAFACCKLFYNNVKIRNHPTKDLTLGATTLSNCCYQYMFQGCTGLTRIPELPATTLANACYYEMFRGCTALNTKPVLPATTLAYNCYRGMFKECTALTTAPDLPATTLAEDCYGAMFADCTNLQTAPELPATTLEEACYGSMFSGCTSLTTAPELPATTLATDCYNHMFDGCIGLTATPELPATTMAHKCYYYMFYGCTNLTSAPALPSTELATWCYNGMFYNCANLAEAPVLPATTLFEQCYADMFHGTSLATAPVLPATTLAKDCYAYMFSQCSNLNYVKCLATDISADNCTLNWLAGVSSTGTFVNAAGMDDWEIGQNADENYYGIPEGWTVNSINVFDTDGNWNVASNWSGNTVPTAGSDVAIVANATVPSGYTANAGDITLYGTLTIADGGQLIHNNAGVVATVEKDITGYDGGTGKWNLIASPVDSNLAAGSVANLVDGTYDLYQLDQSKATEEWCNYKANTFTIDNQKGYLYANNANVTLEFTGNLKPSNANVAVDLAYTSGNRIAGYNLVGNPFPCNAYANKAYYAMNAAGTNFEAKTTSDAIAPCTGVVVCATGTGQSVTFSKTAPDASINKGSLQIALAETSTRTAVVLDNAFVSFNEEELGKFVFNSDNACIYLSKNGKDYAVANAEMTGEMPLNFKAANEGTYTLSVEPKDVEMNYLHLVDKLTGDDIDLLATPIYTFEAKASDNANRFRLVFAANDVDEYSESTNFAYFNGSEWVIENDGQATLQVIDVMGRMLRNEIISGNATTRTDNLSAGVYVMRLVNGEKVKTQKIVVEQ